MQAGNARRVYENIGGHTMLSNTTRLSRALVDAGFENAIATKMRLTRAHRAGKLLERVPRDKGIFFKYADPRAGGLIRHKFELRTDSHDDAVEAQDIAKRTVPDAATRLAPNGTLVTIIWAE